MKEQWSFYVFLRGKLVVEDEGIVKATLLVVHSSLRETGEGGNKRERERGREGGRRRRRRDRKGGERENQISSQM